jgi:DNA-binding transcriptional ArsR family regulator
MTMVLTYNPGALGEDDLIRSFVVRQVSMEQILETVQANSASTSGNQHVMVIGPRGIGKTTLVRRVAAEIRRDSTLGSQWFPIVFGEESYQVGTPGEFWLEALFHLGLQSGDEKWTRIRKELNEEKDDVRLRDRALGYLMEFADEAGKRLLVVVENLHMLLGEQLDHDAAWDLRYTLLNEKRVMMLGTATSRFDEIAKADQAWFDLFAIHDLAPLDQEESRTLWQSVAGDALGAGPARAIQILTGGTPRLLGILATFAAKHSFSELMDQLVRLIDDHTEYFKSHLDGLAAQERKVFVALLENWDPIGATELAKAARLSVNEVSVQLKRLQNRGAVEVAQEEGRRRLYQASERLYNLYYLMRRRGGPADRVRMVVTYLVVVYGHPAVTEIALEACGLPEGSRAEHYAAFGEILRRYGTTLWVLVSTPAEFLNANDFPDDLKDEVDKQFDTELKWAVSARDWSLAETLCRKAIHGIHESSVDRVERWILLSSFLAGRDIEGSERALASAIGPVPYQAEALAWLRDFGFFRTPMFLALGLAGAGCFADAAQLLELGVEMTSESRILAAWRFALFASCWGRARQAIETLAASEHAAEFEPFIFGMKIHLGETPSVAKEVLEVARDFARAIDEAAPMFGRLPSLPEPASKYATSDGLQPVKV